ncbi:MAG: amidohydrolase family protein [Alphaproteobacteria bacterium]|nr:amidohydrolase family protein [Alphaproteobacteria bacterium]
MTDSIIVRGRWVVAGADEPVIHDGAVFVEDGTVREVGPWNRLRGAHPDASVLGSDNVAVIPGLINAHHHSAGVTGPQHGIPDLLLESWILARAGRRPTDIYLETLISAARLLGSGVTSVVDVHSGGGDTETYSDEIGQALAAYDEAGIRVAFAAGISTQSFIVSGAGEDSRFLDALPADLRADAEALLPEPGRIDERDYLAVMDLLCKGYANHPTIDIWYGPPGPQWVSDAFLLDIAAAAARHGTGIQTHVEESFYEKLHGPRDYGKPTVFHLRDLGVLGPRFSIAHGVWLTEPEIAVMAETGAALSHNPSSNLRLRAGIAPLSAMLEAGMTVALGMDGTALNDDEDMFAEMRLALRLARAPHYGVDAPSPAGLFGLATLGGARLLGKENSLGRLAPGYAADLVLIDLSQVAWPWVAPEADPLELLVMRAKAGDVTTVLVGGEIVYRDGMPTGFDLAAAASEIADRLETEPFPAEAAARAERLRPHVEAYYQGWDLPDLDPYTRYNARR